MKIRNKVFYYKAAIWMVVILIVIVLKNMHDNESFLQKYQESELPLRLSQESEDNPAIRVLLKTNGFQQITHPQVELKAKSGLTVTAGKLKKDYSAGEVCSLFPDSELFQQGSISVEPKVNKEKIYVTNLKRGCGTPAYRGKIELYSTAEGIVMVNELLMEEYLCAVVPSEMPASYEMEALKVQAVCARSYAYCQTRSLSYPQYNAHVDDSTSFQVYGNSKENKRIIQAVTETAEEKLRYQGQIVKTYYYSTSCGESTSVEAWGTKLSEKNQYLCGTSIRDENGEAYEKELPWYRWEIELSAENLSDLLTQNTGEDIGELTELCVTKRGVGNIAIEVQANGTKGEIRLITENKIRKAFGGNYTIVRNDGTTVNGTDLLPSAFFTIENIDGIYKISGGGYGHGIGMSQNGANEMAKTGMDYKTILKKFYPGTYVGR